MYLNWEAAMHEEWSPITHPFLKSSFIDDRKPYLAESPFNGINGSMANPERAPILRTKSVTKKQMKKCMTEIKGSDVFRIRDLAHQKPIL